MTKNKYLSLAIIILITFLAPTIGSYTTSAFKEPWYSQLILPSFNPPSWVFAPVWTILYLMMSLAIWKIWAKAYDIKILKIYLIHIFFNCTWTVVFFWISQDWFSFVESYNNFNFYNFFNERIFYKR